MMLESRYNGRKIRHDDIKKGKAVANIKNQMKKNHLVCLSVHDV